MIAPLLCLLLLQVDPEVKQRIDAGLRAKAAGDLDGAIREFTRVSELIPEVAAAHVNLGAVHLARQNYSAAVTSLRRGLQINPNLPGAHGMLGSALLAQGHGCESILHLETAEVSDLLGVALIECDRPRDAVDRLEAALLVRPNDPDLLYYLSQAHAQLAKQAFANLRAAHPDHPRTHQALAEALASSDPEQAAKHLRRALADRPGLRQAHHALGDLLLQAGDLPQAEQEFRAEAALSPASAATAYRHGLVLAQLGRTEEALRELNRANALQPDMPETLFELGKLLHAANDLAAAERHLRHVLTLEQETPLAESAHFQLAQVYRKLNRQDEAARETKAFQELRAKRGAGKR